MRPSPCRPVILIGASSSLGGFERSVRRLHRRCLRIATIQVTAEPPSALRAQLVRFGVEDATLILTSPEAVRSFLEPFLPEFRHHDIVVGGPSTRAAAIGLGCSSVREGPEFGASGVLKLLSTGPPGKVIYPRSDRAGPSLGRQLRAQGYSVLDLVAYHVRRRPMTERAETWFAHPFTAVITSPSALSELRRTLSVRAFRRFCRNAHPIVLGPRTARASRGHGLRNVRLAGAGPSPQKKSSSVTTMVLRALRAEDGRSRHA